VSWDAWNTPAKSDDAPTWGDYGKAVGAGAASVGADLAAAGRYFYDMGKSPAVAGIFADLQDVFSTAADNTTDSMTKEGRDRLASTITSDKFWEHPASASALKLANMSPMVAASILPGGIVSDATMAAAATAAAGGALNAGGVVDEIYKKADALSDDDLKKASDYYAGLRASGLDEKAARSDYTKSLMGLKPAINFIVGAGVGAIGPAGQAVKGLKGAATSEAGVVGRTATGAAEGAATMGAQSGVGDYSTQQAEVEGGLKPNIDTGALVDHVLEGGAFGAAIGGGVKAVLGKGKTKANEIKARKQQEQPLDDVTPQNAKGSGTGTPIPPLETAPVGNEQNEPTRSSQTYPKAEAAKGKGKKDQVKGPTATTVEAGAPDAAQAAALGDSNAAPPEVAEAAQRVAQPVPPPAPTEAPAPAAAPPEVAAASQRVAPSVTPEVTPTASQTAPEVRAPVEPTPAQSEVPASPIPSKPVPVEIVPSPPEAVATPKPVEPVTPAASAPVVVKKTGRVLKAIKPKEVAAAEAAAARDALKGVEKNAKDTAELEANGGEPTPSKGKNLTAKEKAAREQAGTVAKDAFEKHVPDDAEIPTDAAGREALHTRLGEMVADVEKSGAKIPTKVGYEGTPDHVIYMRAAMDLHRKLGQKSFTGARRDKQIADFMVAERAAKKGDFSVLRETRKVEGDLAKRVDQGDVEAKGGTAGAEAEKDAVQTMIPKSARGSVRDSASEEKPASAGRKLEGAEKAKAIAELNERLKKGKVDIAVARTEKAPEATSAKVVDKAAEKTNTNATEGQKKAGNYAKATVKWHGLDIAIENPKGSVRKGKDANGKEWSVEMPDHYGYVKRTEGADGDQVDTYMGPHPESDHVVVVHQGTLEGNFDEHKAMLGYKNNEQALAAYDRAFSDGRGYERLKDMEVMTPDEFKAWVKSDKPKKAAKEQPADIEASLRGEVPITNKMDPSHPIRSMHVAHARDVLSNLNLEHLSGVPKAIASLMRKHLSTMVGDTEVHTVTPMQMAELTGDIGDAFANLNQGTLGKAHLRQADGRTTVVLRSDQFSSPESTAHATMHELSHAYTMRALTEDPVLYRRVGRMMNETKEFIKDLPKDLQQKLTYALTDEREFVAEAHSNPEVQEVLASVPMSADLAQTLGLHLQKPTMWDGLIATVRRIIEKVTGRIPEGHRMIEGVLRMSSDFDRHINAVKARRLLKQDTSVKVHDAFGDTANLVREVQDRVEDLIKREPMQEQNGKPWFLKMRSLDQVAQSADRYFGRESNPVRKIADAVEMMRQKAATNLRASEPIVEKLYRLEKKYKDTGVWEKFTELVHDETMAGAFADRDLASQPHLGKDTLHGAYGKAKHADLFARHAELPEDLKAARVEAMKFFTDQQNAMSLGIINNRILKLLGVEDEDLGRRIHEGRTTDADADAVGGKDVLSTIEQAKELAKIEGPYFPLQRRGDHVVRATYDVTPPSNAKVLDPNRFEFSGKDARDEAIKYAQGLDTKPTIESTWVDPATGETHYPDGTKVTSKDIQAEQRFRVYVQNRHVEFVDGANEAKELAHEIEQKGHKVEGVEERRYESDRNSDMLSFQMRQLMDSIKRREGYKDLPAAQKNELVQALSEASLRFLGSTRIQTKRLPRRYVEGASKDLTRNTLEYAQSTSGYLAKLEHQPELDQALKEMDEAVTNDHSKDKSLGRSAIANEVRKRVDQNNSYGETPTWSAITKRMMTLSFIDKLFSPAHNIINSLQPSMVTMPVLAGRYGVGRSFDAISKAYRDVSGLGLVKAGLGNTIKKARDANTNTHNLLDQIKANLKPKEREMIDYLADRGSIDIEAGMEIDKLVKARKGAMGKADQALGYVEGMARQMPQAIEMMNRSVTALATYRLEVSRGATHEAAMRKAQEVVNNTQGLYSATNAAPLFNHPVAKISLQFKKYGQMMYHLIGDNIGRAFKNESPEDRMEAIKTLVGLTATHVAMAGALGLPTEPFKYLLMGAQAAGLTSVGWGDVEDKVRQTASNYFGKTGGEILTRGLPRLAGVDLSSRVGLDSLLSFGEPRSQKEADVKKWMWDTLAGAPVALVGDWVKGMNQLWSGNFSKAAENLVPMKFAADSIRAYRQATEGKKSATGKDTLSPYSPMEAVVRMAGFTPSREAEQSAASSAFYQASQGAKDQRTQLMAAWANAKPSAKFSAWKDVQAFNKGKPREAQISMSQLTSYADRRQKEGNQALRPGTKDKFIMDRVKATYNAPTTASANNVRCHPVDRTHIGRNQTGARLRHHLRDWRARQLLDGGAR
jgi:hypothetical protein